MGQRLCAVPYTSCRPPGEHTEIASEHKEKAGEHVGDGIIESYHFSGTFFWFSCDIFNKPWFDPNRTSPHVIERWPGIITGLNDSISVFDVEDSKLYYHDEFWQAHNIKGDM